MPSSMATRLAGFRGEFLWELDIATRQSVAMAEAVPADKYEWRPDRAARTIGEVFVHVATGNFLLLDVVGTPAPADLYPDLPAEGPMRFAGLMGRNDELAGGAGDKSAVSALLKRSLRFVDESFRRTSEDELNRPLHFFGEETTVRRVYLRLLAHNHEHMGQMIAYLRFNGIAPPWPDWRPDRRAQS